VGRATRGENSCRGSHRGSYKGSHKYRGGSYKGGKGDIKQRGPKCPI